VNLINLSVVNFLNKSVFLILIMKSTGPTSYETKGLIIALERAYSKQKKPLYKRLITELKRVRRKKRVVNLSKLNRYTTNNSNVVVMGKLLGSGEIKHKVNVISFDYSKTAIEKLKTAKCSVQTLKEWLNKPKIPSKVIILG
jgi:large subunit ribosomal protein L18e